MSLECRSSFRVVAAFVFVYATLWTTTTYFLDPTVPYDALEALNWAENGEYGSPKNPYFVGAVTALGLLLEPIIPITLYWYLSHFVGVGLGMLGVWMLGKRLFGDNQIALLSLMSLNMSGILNIDIIPYNDNYLLVTLWPYMFLFFVKAIHDNPNHWFSLAAVSGIAGMSKYSSCAFLPFMFAYTVLVPEARNAYKSPKIYLAVLLMLLIAFPNVVWLYQHDFAAFNWVESRLTFGINFKLVVFVTAVFYPVIVLALILKRLGGRWMLPTAPERRAFLWSFLSPIVLILGYLLMHRGGSVTEWLQPFVVLAPTALLSLVDFERVSNLRPVIRLFGGLSLIVLLGYSFAMLLNLGGAGSKNNFVGKVSADVNEVWRKKYDRPLSFVGGSRFSHWLTIYAPDRPRTVTPWSNTEKPNIYNTRISERDFRRDGALFISEPGASFDEATLALDLSTVPGVELREQMDFTFENERGGKNTITLGFVPPQSK